MCCKIIRKICADHGVRVSLGTWSERKSRSDKQAAIIHGPRSKRKAAKIALENESKKMRRGRKY